MGTTKRSIKSQSLFLHSLEKTGGKSKKKKTETKKVEPKVNLKSRASKIKIPTPNYNFSRKSLFRDYHRTIEYRDLGKTLINKQKEPQQWLLESAETGDFPGGKTLFGKKPKATYVKSSKKRSPLSTTTNQKIPDYQGQIDHIVPVEALRAFIEREELLPTKSQAKEIYTSEKITQYLSRQENIDKGAKRLWEYSKETGWGTTERPQTFNPERQATRYAEAMTEAARILGAEGGMTRHDQEAYSRIKGGKLPDDIHLKHSAIKNKAIRGFPKYPAVGKKENQEELPALQKDSPFPATPATPKLNIKIQPVTKENPTPSITPALSDKGKTSAVKTKSIITAPPKIDKKVDADDDATIAEVLGWLDEPIEKKEQTEETEAQRRGRLAGEAAAKSVRKRADAAISERNVVYQKPFKRKGVQLPFIRITG